jgi:hypothetical protein
VKRKDALRKVRTVCRRLDEVDPETFFVIPVRMYLFGSVLTAKPKPEDIDMLFEYQEPRDRDEDDLVYRLFYGKPLPYEQAFQHLRRGMKMIRFISLLGSVESWLQGRLFPPDTPVRLIWEPGLDWQAVVDEIEANPLAWDPVVEKRHKYLQETAEQILKSKGHKAATEWLRAQG